MSPAQRRKRLAKRKSQNKKKFRLLKLLILLLSFLAFLVVLSFHTRFWHSDSKLTLVINKKEGDVLISVFDPVIDEIVNITIPKNTQVKVARQLGTWKVGSVWQLGENEDLGGRLLAETVTYHFKLPVVAWADSSAEGFASGKLVPLIKAISFPYKTNLKLGDRMKLGLFSLQVKNFKREEINLGKNPFLKSKRLIGGEEGFVLQGNLPVNIITLFSDSGLSEKGALVLIKDATGRRGVAEEVGEIIEVLGAKVAAVKKEESQDLDCLVMGKDKKDVEKLAQVFSCKKEKEIPSGDLDLEIKIGEEFARRF